MKKSTSFTLAEIAQITSSELIGKGDFRVTGVDNLESALESDLTFLANPLYIKQLKKSKAGAILTQTPLSIEKNIHQLIHQAPSKAFQQVIELFHDLHLSDSGFASIHETAVIHPSAQLGEGVQIGPYVVIDQHVKIGAHTKILAHTSIGPHVSIGENCLIHSHVTLRENCELKNHVIIQPGAVIGSCGFGYITDAKGQHKKLQHVGRVVLEDHVEIGANTTLDRGRFKDTLVEEGVKIDNLVQIGHGVRIGAHSLIISQAGIAGSTRLGRHNIIAGQVGIVGHLELGDHITIAARGAVTKNLKHPGRYGGAPALPEDRFYTQQMHFRKLDIYVSKIRDLEKRIAQLESEKTQVFS